MQERWILMQERCSRLQKIMTEECKVTVIRRFRQVVQEWQ